MLRNSKNEEVEKIIILNFALDINKTGSLAKKSAYTVLANNFGKLQNAELYHLVDLSKKLGNSIHYIRKLKAQKILLQAEGLDLSEQEINDINLFDKLRKVLTSANKIIILGHCAAGNNFIRSDSKVKTTPKILCHLFPKKMNGKHIDIIACEGLDFAKKLVTKLHQYMLKDASDDSVKMESKFECMDMTLSAKKDIVIPIPNGGKLHYKITKSGLPKIFRTGKAYRRDFFIANDEIVLKDISNKNDKIEFKNTISLYKSNPSSSLFSSRTHSTTTTTTTTTTTMTTTLLTANKRQTASSFSEKELPKEDNNENSCSQYEVEMQRENKPSPRL